MLVKNWMSINVFTVDVNDSLSTATNLQKENGIRALPVMKAGELVGIITSGDIKRASASDATALEIHELLYLISKIKVKDIMTQVPITVFPTITIVEVAQILLLNKINSVPVVDEDGKLIGIITESDIFKALIALTGGQYPGIDFGLQVQDFPGSIKEITDIIRSHNGRLLSLFISYDKVPPGYRNVYIKVFQIEQSDSEDLKKALLADTKILYVLDYLEKSRDIMDPQTVSL
jgi:acetoin utilization protein AcuB